MVHKSPFQMGRNKAGHPSNSAWSATPAAAHHAPVIQTHCSHKPKLVKYYQMMICCHSQSCSGRPVQHGEFQHRKSGMEVHTKNIAATSDEHVGIERHDCHAVDANLCLRTAGALLPLVSCIRHSSEPGQIIKKKGYTPCHDVECSCTALTNHVYVLMANASTILLAPSRNRLSDVDLAHSPVVAPGHEDVCERASHRRVKWQ